MAAFKQIPQPLAQEFHRTMWAEVGEYTPPAWLLSPPKEPQSITAEERIQGLSAIWAEARVSFPFWGQTTAPDLDWDATFRSYIPRVTAAEDPAEYFRLLQEFVAHLNEGHTYVMLPPWLRTAQQVPPIGVRMIDGEVVVTRGHLPAGTVITHVDGRLTADLLQPPAGITYGRALATMALARVLVGAPDSPVTLGIRRPDGTTDTLTMRRTGLEPRPLFERIDLGEGRVLVCINSWGNPAVVDSFHEAFPTFDGITALVFDMRYNGGGNSSNGAKILARLIAEPVTYGTAITPLYWGAMNYSGFQHLRLAAVDAPVLPDGARPRFDGPVAVLAGPYTGSAAEDFCLMFKASRRGPLVGEATAGSTGNPAVIPLPGGGFAAISATDYTDAAGKSVIGEGVQPDIPCAPTLAGIAAGRDEVLERAMAALG